MAVKPDKHWYPTDEEGREMRAFFAMNILMGLHNVPNYESFWMDDDRMNCPGISSVMPKARYEKLLQYLHLVDNSEGHPRGHPNFDPLFKVRPFLEDATRRFYRYYYPHKELSEDEAMIGFKGRLSMKNYCPAKPTKWGIKVWMCCDAFNGYTCNFQVYTGKEINVERGLPHRVVLDLVSPYLGLGHHVYYDNFFASLPLQEDLLRNKTYACSTVRLNRKGLPPDMKKLKLRQPGDLVVKQAGNHVLTVWYDKRQVAVLSSNVSPGTQIVERRGGARVRKPNVILEYNKFMGGVDLADQLRSYYCVGREGKKWWRYLLWFIVNVCLVNSCILYNMNVPPDSKRKKRYSHFDFRLDVEKQLRAGFTCRKNRVGRLPMAKRTLDNMIDKENVGPHESVKIPVTLSKRQKLQCRLCKLFERTTGNGHPKETTFFCCVCKVALCRVGCHLDYHNNVKP